MCLRRCDSFDITLSQSGQGYQRFSIPCTGKWRRILLNSFFFLPHAMHNIPPSTSRICPALISSSENWRSKSFKRCIALVLTLIYAMARTITFPVLILLENKLTSYSWTSQWRIKKVRFSFTISYLLLKTLGYSLHVNGGISRICPNLNVNLCTLLMCLLRDDSFDMTISQSGQGQRFPIPCTCKWPRIWLKFFIFLPHAMHNIPPSTSMICPPWISSSENRRSKSFTRCMVLTSNHDVARTFSVRIRQEVNSHGQNIFPRIFPKIFPKNLHIKKLQ